MTNSKRLIPLLAGLILLLATVDLGATPDPPIAIVPNPSTTYLPLMAKRSLVLPVEAPDIGFGVNFVNSVDHPADAQMLANGRSTGATWNRWPLYWPRIETADGQFDWSRHDPVVSADITNGLQTNAILLGTPAFYQTNFTAREAAAYPSEPPGQLALNAVQAAAPIGLYDPIFTDGSDRPGPGKQINPANRWARFVFTIVERYKPGGERAQAEGWPAGRGITHWEMWNEPDFHIFWDSSLEEYARLLKVGYLAAKQADPQAQIIFGGLANNGDPDFYAKVLDVYAGDSLAAEFGYFHDIFATHSYSTAWNSWYHVWRAERVQAERGLSKPIWLNESGVPAWDDYPGPVWDSGAWFRATQAEQADYLIQSYFYALFAGADAYFHFQLYDGCGNQPAGTDFPPHNGELCNGSGTLISDPSKPCAGDANGLFRNPSDAICFSQHPQPESGRPMLTALQLLTQEVDDVVPLWRERPGGTTPYNGTQELIALYQPGSGRLITGMWALSEQGETAVLEARSQSATLIGSDGSRATVTPVNGQYTIQLPGATNRNNPSGDIQIGGRTYILIEELR